MAVNPDPKPGRWILPLVILGMIAFTYFFVRELPEASTDTTPPVTGETTTTVANGEDNGEETPPTNGETPLDPETQAYLDELAEISSELQTQSTELAEVNSGFDAEPREVEFSDAVSRFEAAESSTDELAERHSELTPPAGLESNHQNLQTSVDLAAESAAEALAGLQSDDPGDRRRAAASAFETAADDYASEVTNTNNAASALAGG